MNNGKRTREETALLARKTAWRRCRADRTRLSARSSSRELFPGSINPKKVQRIPFTIGISLIVDGARPLTESRNGIARGISHRAPMNIAKTPANQEECRCPASALRRPTSRPRLVGNESLINQYRYYHCCVVIITFILPFRW